MQKEERSMGCRMLFTTMIQKFRFHGRNLSKYANL